MRRVTHEHYNYNHILGLMLLIQVDFGFSFKWIINKTKQCMKNRTHLCHLYIDKHTSKIFGTQ